MKKLILTTITFFVFFNFSNAFNYKYYYLFGSSTSSNNSSFNSYYDSSVVVKKNDSVYETKYLHKQRQNLSKDEIKEIVEDLKLFVVIIIGFVFTLLVGNIFKGNNRISSLVWLLALGIILLIMLQLYQFLELN